MEKHFLIPADLLQAIVEYMSERPWKEVGRAMPQLLALKEATFDESQAANLNTKERQL